MIDSKNYAVTEKDFNYAVNYSDKIQSDALIIDKFKEVKTCCHIRLGDGEAKLLSYPKYISRETLDLQLNIWFGEVIFSEDDISFMRKELIKSIENCDILGLPGRGRIESGYSEKKIATDTKMCILLYRVLFLDLQSVIDFENKLLCSASSHLWMHGSKNILKLIDKKKLLFISKSNNVGNIFEEKKIIQSKRNIEVPAESWSRESNSSNHFPEVYSNVIKKIHTIKDIDLGIVGAGPLGKIYSYNLKLVGIPSIDMGSVIDIWDDSIPKERSLFKKNKRLTLEWLLG